MKYVPVPIPSSVSFLPQWNPWIHSKVSKHFKRDKDRIQDTVQNVRLRLLQKDFIGRWFFKHLRDEVVDLGEACRILGGAQVTFIGQIPSLDVPNDDCQTPKCVSRRRKGLGCSRACPKSLWRVSDLLSYAQFDYDRYYYSPQGHTIDSERVLRLIGYPVGSFVPKHKCSGDGCQGCKAVAHTPGAYAILESLYRQGKLKPAELTEHECSRTASCVGCEHGRSLLRTRGLSLADRWDDSPQLASKLRWNDSQLVPFLRHWRGKNLVHETPQYIMRCPDEDGHVLGIDAGLLKYVEIIINNEVVNDFKRMSRSDDVTRGVFNKGLSPEFSNSDLVALESEEGEERPRQIFRDLSSLDGFNELENKHDVRSLIEEADLTEEERDAIMSVELMEMTVRQYAEKAGMPVPRVHRVRASAMRKLRGDLATVDASAVAERVCGRHGCSVEDLSGDQVVGPCVVARTEVFSTLFDYGMSVQAIASHFGCSEGRVTAAINRMCLREMRT